MTNACVSMNPGVYGPVVQLGYVAKNFQESLKFWISAGVGPFFVWNHIKVERVCYRGAVTNFDMSCAVGYWGDMQIELFDLHDDRPSAFREYLQSGKEGLHHICSEPVDLDDATRSLEKHGGIRVQETDFGACKSYYYEMPGTGPFVELVRFGPQLTETLREMREAARGWDGSNPVRSIG